MSADVEDILRSSGCVSVDNVDSDDVLRFPYIHVFKGGLMSYVYTGLGLFVSNLPGNELSGFGLTIGMACYEI